MKRLDGYNKIPVKTETLKEEQRKCLSSNNTGSRCSSLGFNPNSEFVTEDIALDYLASLLVELFLEEQTNEYKQKQNNKSSDLLPGIEQGTS